MCIILKSNTVYDLDNYSFTAFKVRKMEHSPMSFVILGEDYSVVLQTELISELQLCKAVLGRGLLLEIISGEATFF